MKHLLTEDQEENFLKRIGDVYRNFKKINGGNWTHESAYKEGIIDFCDSLVFVSSEITYDVCHLRSNVEDIIDEIDSEDDKND